MLFRFLQVDRSGLSKQLGRAGLSSDSQDSFVGVAGGHQGGQKLRDMLRPSSLHCDIDGGVAQVDAVIGAVVGSLDDVGAVVGQNSGQAVQGAGIIGEVNPQADQASVFHQSALDNAREQGDVDVAATDKDRD